MKKISIILLILCLSGCSSIRPSSTILIYPVGKNGIKKVEITQTRLGKTELKDDNFTVSYDSKGTSIIQDVTKEIMPILLLEAIKD